MTTAPALDGRDRLALLRFLLTASRALAPHGPTLGRTHALIGAGLTPDEIRQLVHEVYSPLSPDQALAGVADASEPVRHLALALTDELAHRAEHALWDPDWRAFRNHVDRALPVPEAQRDALHDLGFSLSYYAPYSRAAIWDLPALADAGIDPAVLAAASPNSGAQAVGRMLERQAKDAAQSATAWDRTDWTLVALAALAGVAADLALVRTPADSPLTSRLHALDSRPGKASPDDPAWFQWFADKAVKWEATSKVPFDRCAAGFDGETRWIDGMYPQSHRFQTPGHDPALGLFYGVRDILRGTVTAFAFDNASGTHRLVEGEVLSYLEGPGLAQAVLTWAQHLLSDVATPAGLPAPLFSALQFLNVGSLGDNGRTVAEVARWMYLNGYDLRHFATMGLAPAATEGVLRFGVMARRYRADGAVTLRLAADPKYRAMRIAAHGTAAAANGLRAYLTRNPLAINQAQWLALGRYALPEAVRWVRAQLRDAPDPLAPLRDAGWLALGAAARPLVEAACQPPDAPARARAA